MMLGSSHRGRIRWDREAGGVRGLKVGEYCREVIRWKGRSPSLETDAGVRVTGCSEAS